MTNKSSITSTYSVASNIYFPPRLPSRTRSAAFIPLHGRTFLPNSKNACISKVFPINPTVRLFGMDRLDVDFSSDDIFQAHQSPSLVGEHVIGASSSLIVSSSALFRTILGTISYSITSMTTLLLPMAAHLQRAGETLLAALLLLSFIQAMVALYQYRYDVRGQLIFPDGLTLGSEDYFSGDGHAKVDISDAAEDEGIDKRVEDSTRSLNNTYSEAPMSTTLDKLNSSWVAQAIKKLNKSSVLLLPWITQNVHNLLTKNTHLFHIGFIVFILDSLLPFIMDGDDGIAAGDDDMGKNAPFNKVNFGSETPSLLKKINGSKEHFPSANKDPIRVLVLGDSLSVGTGCIEQYDAAKDNSVPMALIENTAVPQPKTNGRSQHPLQGPVFPQVFARTLSYHFRQPVRWRSAGVDGGDVNDIRSFCMDVVKQESTVSDGGIDIVVVIFGMNDLKKLLSVNPIQQFFQSRKENQDGGGITSRYRHGMESLLTDISSCAPDALVVFPALPIQRFHKNSIINIFPLGLMVDTVVGLWERQKKIVANSRDNTMYVELKAKEIADWYSPMGANNGNFNRLVDEDGFSVNSDFDDIKDDVLLSADGVHPNKRMYSKWAELVGHKLYTRIITQSEQLEEHHGQVLKETKYMQLKRMEPAKGYIKDKYYGA